MSDIVVPTNPDPALTKLIFSLLRLILTAVGAAGMTVPAVLTNQSVLWSVAGALALFVAFVLQIVEDYRNSHAVHAAAQASARVGRPVRPA